ncbi:MAG TPA: flagellar hook assembly protein FlgD [Kofleriaceae bacterium]|nr:flagellar hook assembly protein FlgD [Kofleriaceae bacterium]
MTISATSSVTSSATSSTPQNQLQGTQDEFLKLFMAQLENQDPLDPSSGADMVAQLAQFSSVEQQTETNQQLASLAAAQSSTSNAQLSSLVGRTCDVATGDFTVASTGGAPPPIDVSSTSAMKGASVVITDANGNTVRRIPISDGSLSSTVQWDGRGQNGAPVAPGSYHVAIDPGTSPSSITSTWHGRVDAVDLDPSAGTQLQMGDLLFAPSGVTSIGAQS